MAENIRKFHSRAPRYILRAQDRNIMRFGLQEGNLSTVQRTLLLNLSETGVAFVTTSTQRFDLGDLIMVEIPIPGGDQIAWWARVIRIQTYEPHWWGKRDSFFDEERILVGAVFEKLPEGHSRALRRGIDRSFIKAVREQRYATLMYYRTLFVEHFLQFMAYMILCALAFGFLYWITRPDAHYDAERGSPWGQRFK